MKYKRIYSGWLVFSTGGRFDDETLTALTLDLSQAVQNGQTYFDASRYVALNDASIFNQAGAGSFLHLLSMAQQTLPPQTSELFGDSLLGSLAAASTQGLMDLSNFGDLQDGLDYLNQAADILESPDASLVLANRARAFRGESATRQFDAAMSFMGFAGGLGGAVMPTIKSINMLNVKNTFRIDNVAQAINHGTDAVFNSGRSVFNQLKAFNDAYEFQFPIQLDLNPAQLNSSILLGLERAEFKLPFTKRIGDDVVNAHLPDWDTSEFAQFNTQKLDEVLGVEGGELIALDQRVSRLFNKPERVEEVLEFTDFKPVDGNAFNSIPTEEGRRAFAKEYVKQLLKQEELLNNMTVDQLKKARDAFKAQKTATKSGRNPLAAAEQETFGEEFLVKVEKSIFKSLRKNNIKGLSLVELRQTARVQASEIKSTLDALHEPDNVIGGFFSPKPTRMGLSSVNSAIGASWPSRIKVLDNYLARV
tara:strand:+ start:2775 stop:4205 length:1431 start_codon:yes stop_codon:yes gene_type:complete